MRPHYRRVTWTAKGFKEYKWRCISRLESGKKRCRCSPSISEEHLHSAISTAINSFCENKESIAELLRYSITETLDPTLNGSVLAAQKRIDELAKNIDELIGLASTTAESTSALADIQKFSEEMKTLRSFIETEKSKRAVDKEATAKIASITKQIENVDFCSDNYDDVATRHLIERITVIDKGTVVIKFKGGFEVKQAL